MVEKTYQSYYTKSKPIIEYMISMLDVKDDMLVLEPAAGDGVFIDAILERNGNVQIDAFEINPDAIKELESKYIVNKKVNIIQNDTLLLEHKGLFADFKRRYDRVIANPPYGAWQDYSKRAQLKKLYSGLYVKETYALFLYKSLRLLEENGRLVFIIPDTFLNLHRHKQLRQCILKQSKIKEIALFPSSFFPGISFGYSNLSILTLEKCSAKERCMENSFKVLTNFPDVHSLSDSDGAETVYEFTQKDIYQNIDHALFVCDHPGITAIINDSEKRIGDIADCVTGFYSGDDKKFLHARSRKIRNSTRYKIVPNDRIYDFSDAPPLCGIEEKKCFVPVVKGGGQRYYKPDNWFMDWSVEAVNHYRSDAKSRFQNSQFYFQSGLAVPMISSSRISAAIMHNRLFDQSIVGIFPHDPELLYFLLAFFNSPVCNTLIRTINPSANNPANYIKKIPFIAPSGLKRREIESITKEIVKDEKNTGQFNKKKEKNIHEIFAEMYGL